MQLLRAVRAYTPATSDRAGSIAIGSRTYEIARGTGRTVRDKAPLDPGSRVILEGTIDADGRLTDYAASPLAGATCSQVRRFSPARYVTLGNADRDLGSALFIPPGTVLEPASLTGYRCFAVDVDANGDAIATKVVPPPPVQVN